MSTEQPEGPKRKRTVYTQQFKLDAAKLVVEGGRSVAEVARNLGVNVETLRNWKHMYQQAQGNAHAAFPGKGHLRPEEEELRQWPSNRPSPDGTSI